MSSSRLSYRRSVAVVMSILAATILFSFSPPASPAQGQPNLEYYIQAEVKGGGGSVWPFGQLIKRKQPASIDIYPDPGMHIAKILDNGRNMPISNPYVIPKVLQSHEVEVTFATTYYTIVASVSGGHGTVNPQVQQCAEGHDAAIDLIPDAGYRVESITDNGQTVSCCDPYRLWNVHENHVIVVTYTDLWVVYAFEQGGHGTVSPPRQSVPDGDTATVNCTPDPHYALSYINDNKMIILTPPNPYTIPNIHGDHLVVAGFAIISHLIRASVTGGHGTLTPDSQWVADGQTAAIDITPEAGYHIATITDNGQSMPIADPYLIENVVADHRVEVTFAINQYSISAAVQGGHGSAAPVSSVVNYGDTARILINAEPGYECATIADNGESKPVAEPYDIPAVNADHDVVVTFRIKEYVVTATDAGGHGTVSPGSQTVAGGGTACIDIDPETGYHPATITDNGVPQGLADPYVINNVTAYHSVVVTFAADQLTVNVSVAGTGGSVSPATQTVTRGNNANVSITRDPGYLIATITDNGALAPGPYADVYTINNVTADHDVVVTFKQTDLMVAASVLGGHGTAAPQTQTVPSGDNALPIVFTADPGYHIEAVNDNGVPKSASSPYQLNNVTVDHSVVVTFAADQLTVTAEVCGPGGTALPASQQIAYNGTAAITITPAAGYHTVAVFDNGIRVPGPYGSTYTINPVKINHSVQVIFDNNEYTVTATVSGGHGSIDPPAQQVLYEESATIDITPDPGYHISGIVDGAPVPIADPYIINNVTAAHDVVVSFARDNYTVNAAVVGGGGSLAPATQSVDSGGTAAVNIDPDTGYHIETITDNGEFAPVTSPYVINNTVCDHDVVVRFALNEYTATASVAGGNGTVDPPSQTVKYGGSAAIDITADPGYHLTTLVDNGVQVVPSDPYIITNMTGNHAVVATFTTDRYGVYASVEGGHGSVHPATQIVDSGGTAVVDIVADDGYHVSYIVDNDRLMPVTDQYVITDVTTQHEVTVGFALNEYTVKAAASGGNGAVTPGKQSVSYGDAAVIELEPEPGYHAESIIDNGESVPVTNPYFIEDVTRDHSVTVSFEYTPSSVFYLAEGSTDHGFSTYISIENPNAQALNVDLEYLLTDGTMKTQGVGLPALSQVTVNPADTLGTADFSTVVTCRQGSNIAVDRTMIWTGPGAPSPEGHSSVGVTAPATTWYLPEGCSAYGFETWTLVVNPNNDDAVVSLTYMVEGLGPRVISRVIPAHTRATYSMEADIGQQNASIEVGASIPVVAERAVYRNNRREGSDSVGTDAASTSFYLAEGSTAWGFTTYVLVQNPNDTPAQVTLTCMTPTGPTTLAPFTMEPETRKTLNMNQLIPDTDFSTEVTADVPIVAERAMYWDNGTGQACHDSIGLEEPHVTVYLPDGQTSSGRETWTLVANPNDVPVEVMVSYLYSDGTGSSYFNTLIPAKSRTTFSMADRLPSGRASIVVTCLTQSRKIIAERAMYWNRRGAGTETVGDWSH